MNPRAFSYHDEKKRDTYYSLKEEYDEIKIQMERIKEMCLKEENEKNILEELQGRINEVKERMHDYIDTL